MLEHLKQNYNSTVDVQRLTDAAGGKENYAAHLSAVGCLIVPLDDSVGADLQGSFGKDYTMYCEAADIQEGDKVISGSTSYKVIGMRSYSFMGNDLMEIRIRDFIA